MWSDQVLSWLEENERPQAWLAKKANISGSYLNLLLQGKRPITEKSLKKLAKATGLVLTMPRDRIQAKAS